MHRSLEKKFNTLTQAYDVLIQQTSEQSEAIQYAPMTDKKWSMVQTVHHLNIALAASLKYLQYKLKSNAEFEYNPVLGYFRSVLANAALNTNIKFKAPRQLQPPLPEITIEEVKDGWLQIKAELKNLLDTMPDDLVKKNIFKHPAIGRFKAEYMLSFYYAHVKHHERQIQQYLTRVSR